MTPAVATAKKKGIRFSLHEFDHDPDTRSYGREAAEKLGISPDQLFKTLVAAVGAAKMAVAVVPVAGSLDLKALARVFGVKKAAMAEKKAVEKMTGYLTGGVSPIGQKKQLPVIIDESAREFDRIYVSAGRRGLQMGIAPLDLARLTRAGFHMISRID